MAEPLPVPTPAPTANVDTANSMVQGNQFFVKHNPQLAAAGILSGNPDTMNTLAASSHMVNYAKAIDDHVATYNSGPWFANIFKDAKDIPAALIKNAAEIAAEKGLNQ
jgi:hypothetical protein